jgi:MoaA/NifB/PqqE/SkfB family radical SAM enzyme
LAAGKSSLDQHSLTAYNESRDFSHKIVSALCYAPYTSLYFDFQGRVRVCCHNYGFPAGNIEHNSLDEIWHGARISLLREALKQDTFGPGCEFCKFQTAEGNFTNAAMRRFDGFDVISEVPEWPQQFEFSISNSCNLECVMCKGTWSSAIRKNREKLAPYPHLYSNTFINSLRLFLPHLKRMKFLGGEPFLITEYFKIWKILIEDELAIPCHVTTNGTQFNDRIERVMDKIPMSFAVSMDGVSKATVERIRVNAVYDEVMQNARRFRDYAHARKTSFSLTYCLMRINWQEFGDYCLMADAWDCAVALNTVVSPPEFGIYSLPVEELRIVLDGMDKQAIELNTGLKRNKKVWFGELERIRAKVQRGVDLSPAKAP